MGHVRRLANATPLQTYGSDSCNASRAKRGWGWPGIRNDRVLCPALEGSCRATPTSATCQPAGLHNRSVLPLAVSSPLCRLPRCARHPTPSQSTPLRSPIENFYMTDAISRASRTMAKCVLARQQAQAK